MFCTLSHTSSAVVQSLVLVVDRMIAQAVHDPVRDVFDVEERAVQELEEPHWATSTPPVTTN